MGFIRVPIWDRQLDPAVGLRTALKSPTARLRPVNSHRRDSTTAYGQLRLLRAPGGIRWGATFYGVPRGTDRSNLDRLIPIWIANENSDRQLILSFLAVDHHGIRNFFATKPADPLANPH